MNQKFLWPFKLCLLLLLLSDQQSTETCTVFDPFLTLLHVSAQIRLRKPPVSKGYKGN